MTPARRIISKSVRSISFPMALSAFTIFVMFTLWVSKLSHLRCCSSKRICSLSNPSTRRSKLTISKISSATFCRPSRSTFAFFITDVRYFSLSFIAFNSADVALSSSDAVRGHVTSLNCLFLCLIFLQLADFFV